jgi:ribosomal protein L29
MLKIEELKKMTTKELTEEFDKATKDLFKVKFEVNTGASKANNQIGDLKKYRARLLTIKNQLKTEEVKKFSDQKKVKTVKVKKEKK